ncbi:MAG: pilus assembly PilX family protein [Caldimonas sp.]
MNKHGQRGIVLFVAMIVLVVMALAGIAMVRQSGSGLSIAGNLSFKQNATSAGDLGTEAALNWWAPLKNTSALDNDVPAEGYYSDWGSTPGDTRLQGDPSLYDWSLAKVIADDGLGNEVSYIIERLCLNKTQNPNDPAQLCVKTPPLGGGDYSGTCQHYPSSCGEDRFFVHYRISTRIRGPKQTLSYIQVMVH